MLFPGAQIVMANELEQLSILLLRSKTTFSALGIN
jgi:hypothetical protein